MLFTKISRRKLSYALNFLQTIGISPIDVFDIYVKYNMDMTLGFLQEFANYVPLEHILEYAKNSKDKYIVKWYNEGSWRK